MFTAISRESRKTKVERTPTRAKPNVESATRVQANPLWHQLATRVQRKFTVGAANDPLEQEADRVADQVMRMPDPAALKTPSNAPIAIQRQPAPTPSSPPPPEQEPLRPLVTTFEIDIKTDSQELGKGAGEAAGRTLDTPPGKAAEDAASAQLERDWRGASAEEKVLMVGTAIGIGGAALALLRAIPEGDDAPPAPEKTPKIKIGNDFKVQLELKLGWKDKAPDGSETQRRSPRIDGVTVSLFYSPEGPKGPSESELIAAEIARLQASLTPFRPKVGDAGFAIDYATRRMLEERARRPGWLPSAEEAARHREADRFKLDAGPFGTHPRPGVRLLPELELGPMPAPGTVQRQCAACEVEADEEVRLEAAGPAVGSADAAVTGLGGGAPLPAGERQFFGQRLGQDFSGVRVHSESPAAPMLGARAFTLDQDIAFAPGEWRPGTVEGRKLLAHELVHVVQQSRGAERAARHQPMMRPDAVPRPPPPSRPTVVVSGICGPDAPDTTVGRRLLAHELTHTIQRHSAHLSVLWRKPDDIAELIRNDDWHGAAWTLAQRAPAEIAARVEAMSSVHRQYLVEGAGHGEGRWNTDAIISAVYKVSQRDAIIGSVSFFVWKRLWSKAGTYLCGLNDDDMRRIAIRLRLSIRDMQVMADEQPDKERNARISTVLLGSLELVKQAPRDLVAIGKGGEKLVENWLLKDQVVGPYAKKGFGTGRRLSGRIEIVPEEKWSEAYKKRGGAHEGYVMGFFSPSEDRILVRQGEQHPGTLIHEAIHFLAVDDLKSLYGFWVNEGITDYFARTVAVRAGLHPDNAYPQEQAGAAALARVVGDDILASALFAGKVATLRQSVDDAKGSGTFSRWADAMQDEKERKNAPDILK